ncbi:MAG TPA: hypothetical protein VJ876_05465 [Bacteroidales bacterium]|nr:hypothetical protein [Bacteroidales bacterium]
MSYTNRSFVLLGLLLLVAGGCTNTIRRLSSTPQPEKPIVDAVLDDWEGKLEYDPKSHFFYGITHDRENIYLALQVKHPAVQRKIMAFGMTVWYDTTGRREKAQGIRYPVPVKERMPTPEAENTDLPLRTRQAQPKNSRRYLRTTDKDHMLLLHFDGKERQRIAIEKAKSIQARVRTDTSVGVLYELRVPFRELYGSALKEEKKLSIGIVTGFLDLPDGSRPGGLRGGGMIPYGRGKQESSQKPSEDYKELQKSTKLWLKKVTFTQSGS